MYFFLLGKLYLPTCPYAVYCDLCSSVSGTNFITNTFSSDYFVFVIRGPSSPGEDPGQMVILCGLTILGYAGRSCLWEENWESSG